MYPGSKYLYQDQYLAQCWSHLPHPPRTSYRRTGTGQVLYLHALPSIVSLNLLHHHHSNGKSHRPACFETPKSSTHTVEALHTFQHNKNGTLETRVTCSWRDNNISTSPPSVGNFPSTMATFRFRDSVPAPKSRFLRNSTDYVHGYVDFVPLRNSPLSQDPSSLADPPSTAPLYSPDLPCLSTRPFSGSTRCTGIQAHPSG